MKPIVKANRVGKRYSRSPHSNKRHSLTEFGREILGLKRDARLRPDEFWAVRDISFTMFPGDSLALVGRNGSGKTTLLKMLNGIIPLDEGDISITQNVQALINLGAGFHANLSGRDNIYNSAALLGLSRKETASIVSNVIDFSELGEFIDSPVSTYSSGMHARLGFSVAVNLHPRLVLVDEILSVGDCSFRNKCLKHMQKLKKDGVGMILVSHNATQIIQFCEQAIWVDQGRMRAMGDSKTVVQEYLDFMDQDRAKKINTRKEAAKAKEQVKSPSGPSMYGIMYPPDEDLHDIEVKISSGGRETNSIKTNQELGISYSFTVDRPVEDLNVSIVIYNEQGEILTAISTMNGQLFEDFEGGRATGELSIPDLPLAPGKYTVVMPVHNGASYLYRGVVGQFYVVLNDYMTWGTFTTRYSYKTTTQAGAKDFDNL